MAVASDLFLSQRGLSPLQMPLRSECIFIDFYVLCVWGMYLPEIAICGCVDVMYLSRSHLKMCSASVCHP